MVTNRTLVLYLTGGWPRTFAKWNASHFGIRILQNEQKKSFNLIFINEFSRREGARYGSDLSDILRVRAKWTR